MFFFVMNASILQAAGTNILSFVFFFLDRIVIIIAYRQGERGPTLTT